MDMIQIKEENGCMTISFDGRLDSSLTTEIQQELAAKLNDAPGVKELTWDGCGMEYISSSGLRLMLMLKKKYPSFKLVNVCPDVYNVFEMTGFTKMMTVER